MKKTLIKLTRLLLAVAERCANDPETKQAIKDLSWHITFRLRNGHFYKGAL
jgi:hypothetical protein